MNARKLVRGLFWLGVVGAVLVTGWWALVFYHVGAQTGESLMANVNCLYAASADCNLLRGMAWLKGINPYEPVAFWWMASTALMAWLIGSAMDRQAQ